MRKLRTFIRRCAAYRDLLWLGLILFLVIFTRMHVGFAAGEGSEQIVSAGTGLDGTFDTKLKELALGAIKAMQIVLLIMTAIAGMMSTFGLEEGKKFLWQVMLGAGLAINFGGFVATIFAGLTGADPETVFDGTGPTVVGAAKGVEKMISSPIITLLGVITIVIVCFCFFMAALELFMARVEFFTMALMTIPCLAFGTMSKFNFLTEKAIGCMFNCAMKVCVIAFLAISTTPFVESFMLDASKKDELSSDAGSLLQAVLASLMIYMLIKKIPALISTLLNGAPQLSGSDMIGSLKSAAGTAAAVGSAVVTGGATAAGKVAAAKAAGGGTLKGTLSQLGRDFVMSRSPVQSYRSAVSNFRSSKDQTASHNLSMMKKGVTMQQEAQKGGNGGNDANGNGNGGGQGQAAQGQNASQRKDDDN